MIDDQIQNLITHIQNLKKEKEKMNVTVTRFPSVIVHHPVSINEHVEGDSHVGGEMI